MPTDADKMLTWTPTKVQLPYRHQNQRYYAHTSASGKEKWISQKTTLLSVAENRMKEHLNTTERPNAAGEPASFQANEPLAT